MRNHALNLAMRHLIFRPVQSYLNAKRQALGMKPIAGAGMLDFALATYQKYLQATVAEFEYPQLIVPTLEALRDEPVLVVVTAPGWSGPAQRPANARMRERPENSTSHGEDRCTRARCGLHRSARRKQ